MGETLNRTGMVSYLGRGSLSEWVCGVSLFSDEGKIWDCKQGGGTLLQARGLGLCGQGVNALP